MKNLYKHLPPHLVKLQLRYLDALERYHGDSLDMRSINRQRMNLLLALARAEPDLLPKPKEEVNL